MPGSNPAAFQTWPGTIQLKTRVNFGEKNKQGGRDPGNLIKFQIKFEYIFDCSEKKVLT